MKKIILLICFLGLPLISYGAPFLEATGHVKYFGFYGQRIYSDPLVSGYVNVSFASPISANDPLSWVDYHKAYGIRSLYKVETIFFWDDEFGPGAKATQLAPDYLEKWQAFAPTIASRVNDGSIAAFYLFDEPYGNLEGGTLGRQPISRQEAYTQIKKAAQAIKNTFPNTPIFVVEDRLHLGVESSVSPYLFPPEIDWVGFDCYRGTFESCAFEGYSVMHHFNLVKNGLAPNQKMVLVPQAAAYTDVPAASDQAYILDLFGKYIDQAKYDSKVIAVLGFTAEHYGPFSDGKKFWGALEETWGSLNNIPLRDSLLSKGLAMLIPPTLNINKSSVAAGENISVSWSNIPVPKPKDWITLAAPGLQDYLPLDWIYVSCTQTPGAALKQGSCNFKIPSATPPGTYEMRLFENNEYNRLAASSTFTVTAPIVYSTPYATPNNYSYQTPYAYPTPAYLTPGVYSYQTPYAYPTPIYATPGIYSYQTPNAYPTPNQKPPTSYNFGTVTLRNGSRGEAVKELQRFLNQVLKLGLVIDGKLGPKTIQVIKTWQKNNGLVPDGLVGAKTKAMMNASIR